MLPMHRPDCWKVADKVYQFSSDQFFHLYVHQMLAEGVFNMHDHNKMNVSADLKKAAVDMEVNREGLRESEDEYVDKEEEKELEGARGREGESSDGLMPMLSTLR